MAELVYEKEFPSTIAAVADTIAGAIDALVNRGWINAENTFSVRLCLEEALVNAVVHGNENEPSRQVGLRIYADDTWCRVCVHDEGDGFDVDTIKMAECTQMGGRGVCLIKEFMEDVRFNEEQNCLEMRFHKKTFTGACT